jgi:predicted Fe-Mo cluster-binding NifX family protein
MKIAVASHDGVNISPHFGRSACFIVYENEDGQIKSREVRDNTYTPHVKGECKGDEHHEHEHGEHHGHGEIINALHDCDAVLCYGMGHRAAEDLQANGIMPFIVTEEMPADDAVKAYIDGKLKPGQGFCCCH